MKKSTNKVGRPCKQLTQEQLEELKTLSAMCTVEQIADYFDINKDTFVEMRKRDDTIFRAYKKGKVIGHKIIASKLFKKAALEGDTTAIIFYLKTQSGWSEKKHGFGISKISGITGKESPLELMKKTLVSFSADEITEHQFDKLLSWALAKVKVLECTEYEERLQKLEKAVN